MSKDYIDKDYGMTAKVKPEVKSEIQPEMTANDYAELQVYRAFMQVNAVSILFSEPTDACTIENLRFTKVFSNVQEDHDEETPQDRFCVWQVCNLYVRLDGVVSSYGTKEFESWKFVTPKEKTVVVYE